MMAEVWFAPLPDDSPVDLQVAALRKLWHGADVSDLISFNDFVAVKIHVGEKGNTTHIRPELVREVVDRVKDKNALPFLTETSTLYKSERDNAVRHIMHAHLHGFGIDNVGAPFIMADGLVGNAEREVIINGELHESVKIAGEIAGSDVIIAISHPTGHLVTGMGGAIKNLGMGLASRMGKLRQHSAMKPEIITEQCRSCRKCLQWCPKEAIIEREGASYILTEKCIGCGECLAVCRFDAVRFDWGAESSFIQKSMAEHASGVVCGKRDRCFFFNVLVDMTRDCDCLNIRQEKIIPDIGILASRDPVAIDMATLRLTAEANGSTLAELSYDSRDALIQVEHAAKVGLGSTKYRLITLDS
jgi:uncharacterized Fe-S center protein